MYFGCVICCYAVSEWCVDSLSPISVRPVDLAVLLCNVAFLLFLLVRLVATLKRLKGSLQLFKILYCLVAHARTRPLSLPHASHTHT